MQFFHAALCSLQMLSLLGLSIEFTENEVMFKMHEVEVSLLHDFLLVLAICFPDRVTPSHENEILKGLFYIRWLSDIYFYQ